MKKQYHILNGDSLKEQFPKNIDGDLIITRECLIEGDLHGGNLDDFFASRAKFLSSNYGGSEAEYVENTVAEFRKMLAIEPQAEVNLWFEDDLFCQTNFWFVVYLLTNYNPNHSLFLIRPEAPHQYGFSALHQAQLTTIYKNRLPLNYPDKIAGLWLAYQNNDLDLLIATAQELEPIYPFILPAVRAHIARLPTKASAGRPVESLKTIMRELQTREFGPIFQEFSKRESIYGYGDLQVKRLFDSIQ